MDLNANRKRDYTKIYTRRPMDDFRTVRKPRTGVSELRAEPHNPSIQRHHSHQSHQSLVTDERITISIRFTVPEVVHNKLVPSIRRYPYMWAFGTVLGLVLLMLALILLVNGTHLLWHTVHKQPVITSYHTQLYNGKVG